MSDINDELITLPRQLSMEEFDKLQGYLLTHGFNVDIIHRRRQMLGWALVQSEHHQLVVFGHDGTRLWDAVLSDYSYGHEQGLLEVMGSMVVREGCAVEGWLTADEIIKRLEEKDERHAVDYRRLYPAALLR